MKLNNISGDSRLRDVVVSPVGLIRLSAILVVLLMDGHSSAYPWSSNHALHETQLVELMKSVDFEFAKECSTYWNLYFGWGLLISVLLLTMGIVLWLMADLARLALRRVGAITGILSASALVGAYLSWRFFYIPPFIFYLVICAVLLAATVQLRRPVSTFTDANE